MPPIDEMVGSFLIAGACALVMGVAMLLVIYKMIDGEFRLIPGICAMTTLLILIAVSVKPPHPAVPGIALVSVITLIGFFPYAASVLERAELSGINADRLAKAYAVVAARPDNFSARLEVAKMLYALGMREHAITVASNTLAAVPQQLDPVQNRTVMDLFYTEAQLLRRWQAEQAQETRRREPVLSCPACQTANEVGDLLCRGCGRPYLLDSVMLSDLRGRMVNRLLIGWAAVALYFVAAVAIALNFDGLVRAFLFVAALAGVGFLLNWLFRGIQPARTLGL